MISAMEKAAAAAWQRQLASGLVTPQEVVKKFNPITLNTSFHPIRKELTHAVVGLPLPRGTNPNTAQALRKPGFALQELRHDLRQGDYGGGPFGAETGGSLGFRFNNRDRFAAERYAQETGATLSRTTGENDGAFAQAVQRMREKARLSRPEYFAKNADGKKNFKLQGHTEFQGIPIAIENREGSVRKGVDKDGKPWRTVMKHSYGYVKGTKGADGDEVDVFIGPHDRAPEAFVVHQHKSTGRGYDEDKVLLGFPSREKAIKGYLAHYNSSKFLGPVKTVPMDRLKELLASGKKLLKIASPTWLGFGDEFSKIHDGRG